jgi:hypothetical protein
MNDPDIQTLAWDLVSEICGEPCSIRKGCTCYGNIFQALLDVSQNANARAENAEMRAKHYDWMSKDRDDWKARAEKAEARIVSLAEALEQIERYTSDDHVKRRARAALAKEPS